MKKFLSFILMLSLLLTSLPALAVNMEVDGVTIDSDMLFEDSTAYVPLSSMAQALGVRYSFDEKSQSAFVNGINLFPEKGDGVTIYVDGKKYTPSDAGVKIVNGTVYLPAHLMGEAFTKDVKWYKDTATLVFTKKVAPTPNTVIDPNKTYAIINAATGTALSAGENSLSNLPFTKAESQKFTFVPTEFAGYYHIKSSLTGKNFDVYNHGTAPGVSIITWEQGTGDNQKFTIEDVPGGTLISARSCHLPIEPYGEGVLQNARSGKDNQKWMIVEFNSYKEPQKKKSEKIEIIYTPPVKEVSKEDAPYRTLSIGDVYLSASDGLKGLNPNGSATQKWELIEFSEDVFVIENPETKKSADVNARSLEKGASIILYQTSKATNQRWIFEKNGDGTYYIKSVHSNLYLTLTDDNTLIQEEKNTALKQRWTMDYVN